MANCNKITGKVFLQRRGLVSKKLWCCVGGDVKHKILDLSTELIRSIGHRKEIES